MWREKQIALTAKLVNRLARLSAGLRLLRYTQEKRPLASLYKALLGYRRPFNSLAEAHRAVLPYSGGGHEHSRNVALHLELSIEPRPSDYAAFYYLQPFVSSVHKVFDLGGNAGNLFYCYKRYLPWPSDLSWEVKDLPANMLAGEALAKERGAERLGFTSDWNRAADADLLIVSGSMHYMEESLPQMLAALDRLPPCLLINRTPLTEGEPFAAIQDAGEFKIACVLHNRLALIRDLETLGYSLVSQWPATELSLEIPGYPEKKIWNYTGMLLRLDQNTPASATAVA